MTGLMLAIETSCDETAAAVVADDYTVHSNVIASQIDLHAAFGGVVPEVASRAHIETIDGIVAQALADADADPSELSGIAVTRGPGLIGALLIGVATAKALGAAWGLPVMGVNHLTGHALSCLLDRSVDGRAESTGTGVDGMAADANTVEYPAVLLLVSGGHTLLARVDGLGRFQLLGATVDDSTGEAYDKVARYLGLGYPGGPAIDRLAAEGTVAVGLPRPMLDDGLDFSFSGLKTATVRTIDKHPDMPVEDVCASFADACMEVLITKALRAAEQCDARTLLVVGGVAASPILRQRMGERCQSEGRALLIPGFRYATDNAAMIGAAGWLALTTTGPSAADFGADPGLRFGEP